jgi:hypothetical protein
MPQRSPIIFWLLLAATFAVDVVVLQAAGERYLDSGLLPAVIDALLVSQLSVVCIWSALRTTPTVVSRAAPICAVAIVSLLAAWFTPMSSSLPSSTLYANYLGYFGLHALVLLASLWILQRTNYWQRRTGVKRTLQFSLAHVLIVMTVTAVLAALSRDNEFLGDGRVTNISIAFCCVTLGFASVAIWSLSWNWFLRLAGVIAVAALLDVALVSIFFGPNVGFEVFTVFHAYYLIQAVVLSLWLGVGPILPSVVSDAAVSENEASQRPA